MKFITSRMPGVTPHPFFFFKCDLHCVSVESFTATKYAQVLPVCHHHPILPSPNTYLLLIYSTRTHGHIKNKRINGFSKGSLFVLAHYWRSSTQFWHMDLLKHIKCFSGLAKCAKWSVDICFWTSSDDSTPNSQSVSNPWRLCWQSQETLMCSDAVTSHSLNYHHPHLARKGLESPSFHSLPSLNPTCVHYIITIYILLFYYLLLLAHRYPITLSPFENKSTSLFVFRPVNQDTIPSPMIKLQTHWTNGSSRLLMQNGWCQSSSVNPPTPRPPGLAFLHLYALLLTFKRH